MFTGIITELGVVRAVRSIGEAISLELSAPRSAAELAERDSIAVNGVCLTVVEKSEGWFRAEAVEETLRKTTLGELRASGRVNLELPMRISDRLGGHLVLGHVDCVGRVASVETRASSWLFAIEYPPEHARYLIPVGSIAVDGVSLTIADLREHSFVVSIIPYTYEHTRFSEYSGGSRVNLEFDVLGKYVERLLKHGVQPQGEAGGVSEEKLRAWGYNV